MLAEVRMVVRRKDQTVGKFLTSVFSLFCEDEIVATGSAVEGLSTGFVTSLRTVR
jgi:hypothetical protein